MGLKANILRDSQGNIIVQMNGDFDFDNCIPVRSQLNTLADQNPHTKITIDLGGVDFIGSSGLCHFVETIQLIKDTRNTSNEVGLSNVTEEFQKLFRLYQSNDNPEEGKWLDKVGMENDETQTLNQAFGNRKRTFEN
ncbi:STAS domain-containing protein [Bacteriovoracaceae bacterium]|nr:STAS domain-containing protein [Bacteriovoracaceae bacterium]